MPMLPTTARAVEALKPPAAGRAEYNDKSIPGLQLRITANGARSWSLRYRVAGAANPERVTIPATELADVRKQALALKAAVKVNGANPQQARRDAAAAPTFAEVVEAYLTWAASPASGMAGSSLVQRRRQLKRPLAAWGSRTMVSLTRRDVILLLDAIAEEAPVQSNRVREALSHLFARAVRQELVPTNIIRDVDKSAQETAKDRVLSDAEIRAFWTATADGDDVDRALRLQLLTGQRPTEIAGLSFDEVHELDTDAARVELPAARMKARKPHLVPLVGPALELVRDRAGVYGQDCMVFVNGRGNQVTGANLAERMRTLGIGATPHDLRRTVATGLSRLGIAAEDRRAVLAHVAGDVHSKHYDWHDRQAEKRRALAAWGDRVLQIVGEASTSDNVFSLSQACAAGIRG